MGLLDSVSSTLFGPVWTFLCVLCRIGPVLAMMPPVQGAMIPNRVKVMLALMISASVSPMVWSQTSDMPLHLFDLVVADRISIDEALRHADSVNDLRLAIKLHRQTEASACQDTNINDLEIL